MLQAIPLSYTMPVKRAMVTKGDGYWSDKAKTVFVTRAMITNISMEDSDFDLFGELLVFFLDGTWDIRANGLIYTDSGFLENLKEFFKSKDIPTTGLDYSEQGMQGDDYVSFDVDANFIQSFVLKAKEVPQ